MKREKKNSKMKTSQANLLYIVFVLQVNKQQNFGLRVGLGCSLVLSTMGLHLVMYAYTGMIKGS